MSFHRRRAKRSCRLPFGCPRQSGRISSTNFPAFLRNICLFDRPQGKKRRHFARFETRMLHLPGFQLSIVLDSVSAKGCSLPSQAFLRHYGTSHPFTMLPPPGPPVARSQTMHTTRLSFPTVSSRMVHPQNEMEMRVQNMKQCMVSITCPRNTLPVQYPFLFSP